MPERFKVVCIPYKCSALPYLYNCRHPLEWRYDPQLPLPFLFIASTIFVFILNATHFRSDSCRILEGNRPTRSLPQKFSHLIIRNSDQTIHKVHKLDNAQHQLQNHSMTVSMTQFSALGRHTTTVKQHSMVCGNGLLVSFSPILV